eukprot:CAMPEP_0195530544 /NCGR_PEP_ID=MMETSP0794_2-20130614/33474_1 /TAXON_ID=515487 /ORGANISM="Stephanopyxis turris, Strain CCMP 815" /LENGTH=537 /DNA_ID=CAMNT_0040662079 /DNA_START=61 /DNA_END=1674 /DNA_ORIENTATION=+
MRTTLWWSFILVASSNNYVLGNASSFPLSCFGCSDSSHGHALNLAKKKKKKRSVLDIGRGGGAMNNVNGSSSSSNKKRNKNKKGGVGKKKRSATSTTSAGAREEKEEEEDSKNLISNAMKEKDAAQVLGDAIRDRKEILQKDSYHSNDDDHMYGSSFSSSLISLGYAIGTTDKPTTKVPFISEEEEDHDDDGISSSTSTFRTAILANYFLHSHGGAYALQCLSSILSVSCAIACLALPPTSLLKVTLLRRAFMCLITKHASGLFAAAVISAHDIPKMGLYRTKERLEMLAKDAVAQYLFYAALLLVWIPSTTTSKLAEVWWMKKNRYYACLLGPVLVREIVHVAWVLSDVAVILLGGSSTSEHGSNEGGIVRVLLNTASGLLDALMSVCLGANVWRGADAAKRQRLLALFVSRISLLTEIGTGFTLLIDAIQITFNFCLAPTLSSRPPLMEVIRCLVCTRLYIHYFLMTIQKSKVTSLIKGLRGGAIVADVPHLVLDVLLDPKKAMGLDYGKSSNHMEEEGEKRMSRSNIVMEALGF